MYLFRSNLSTVDWTRSFYVTESSESTRVDTWLFSYFNTAVSSFSSLRCSLMNSFSFWTSTSFNSNSITYLLRPSTCDVSDRCWAESWSLLASWPSKYLTLLLKSSNCESEVCVYFLCSSSIFVSIWSLYSIACLYASTSSCLSSSILLSEAIWLWNYSVTMMTSCACAIEAFWLAWPLIWALYSTCWSCCLRSWFSVSSMVFFLFNSPQLQFLCRERTLSRSLSASLSHFMSLSFSSFKSLISSLRNSFALNYSWASMRA